jgi:queuosine precursor transporter
MVLKISTHRKNRVMNLQTLKWITFAAFVATVYGANWALATFGVVSIGFGLAAPAGVFFAGIAFGLRDMLHELGGIRTVIGAIIAGTVLAYLLEASVTIPGGIVAIAIASAAAFMFAELADLAVYAPLRKRNWPLAVVASNVVGAIADSALFLVLAFGSLQYISGQIIGKTAMIAISLPLVWWARRAVSRINI